MTGSAPSLSVVVSTIGRPEELRRLFGSLVQLNDPGLIEVIVVDQTEQQASAAYVDQNEWPFATKTTSSPRGASIGRNAGLALANCPYVCFPDDDCWFDADTAAKAVQILRAESIVGVSGVQLTMDGRPSMLRWSTKPTWVTRNNFYRTFIESTLFLRTEAVRAVGGFTEDIGVGSEGKYQSGEAADLVLKLLDAGGRIWYEPGLIVRQDEPRDDLPENYVEKMSGYGFGFGRNFADHKLSKFLFGRLLLRKLLGSAVRSARGNKQLAAADKVFVANAVTGYRERV